MMQEVSHDAVVVTTAIADQLQEAALTNVTQAPVGQAVGMVTSSSAPSNTVTNIPPLSNVPPPSELPPNLGSNIAPPSQLPPNLGSPIGPPPPTGGFVASPGVVSATPNKYPSSGTPSSPVMPPAMSSYSQSQGSPLPAGFSLPSPPTSYTGSQSYGQQTPYTPTQQPPYTSPTQQPPYTSPTQQTPYTSPTQQTPYTTPGYLATQTQIDQSGGQTSQYTHQMSPPGSVGSPHEASASIDLGGDPMGGSYPSSGHSDKQGLFGWFSGSNFMNKVVEKTKTLSENVITTLDPGMKEVIYSGGGLEIVVASQKEVKVGAVRQAFQEIFGRAMVIGQDSQPAGIAPQPVGYTAGLKGCEERLDQLRRSGSVASHQVLVAVENFIVEVLPDRWFDIGCILLRDPTHQVELQTFTQATPIPTDFVQQAQDQTPNTYDLRWSGLAVTVGQVINRNLPYVNHADWHAHFTGVSRREMIYLGAKLLAGMYRQKIPVDSASQ